MIGSNNAKAYLDTYIAAAGICHYMFRATGMSALPRQRRSGWKRPSESTERYDRTADAHTLNEIDLMVGCTQPGVRWGRSSGWNLTGRLRQNGASRVAAQVNVCRPPRACWSLRYRTVRLPL